MSVLMNKAEIWHLVEEEREYSARLRTELAAANAEIERLKNELGDPRGEIDHAKSISQIARNEALDEAVAAIYSRLKERHNTSSPDFDNGCIGGFQYSIWAIEALKEQS